MGARQGSDVLLRLKSNPAEVWHRGKRVEDVTVEPGLCNGVRSLAGLYDYQWQHQETLLEPNAGGTVARSFGIPRTTPELEKVGAAMKCSAEYSLGMMGREPAYLNRGVSAFAGSADFFSGAGAHFADNVRAYHAHIRDNDLSLTHTLQNPRANKLAGPALQADPEVAAHIARERDDGLVIRGARMLATLPIADEIAVFPAKPVDNSEENARYAFGFAIPTATPGLKFVCRESVDYGFSAADHPLGARFEEMDAVVIFDDVLVPWERVFCYRNAEICNKIYGATGAAAHMGYQVACKNIAKTEYLLGLLSLMIEGSGLESFAHVQDKLAEVWISLETVKAFKRAGEVDASSNAFGALTPAWDPLDASRNLFPKLYVRMIEIIQQVGASGLVTMPTHDDLNGPLGDEIRKYYGAARLQAEERIPLYRLAWDTAVSSFASRQVLYERFFFGDPAQMSAAIFKDKNRGACMERVREFLRRPS